MVGRDSAEWPIDDLGLSTRTRNCLRRAGVTTVWQLLAHSREELLATIPSFGLASYQEVCAALRANRFPSPQVRPEEEAGSSKVRALHATNELHQARSLLRRIARTVAAQHGPHDRLPCGRAARCDLCEDLTAAQTLLVGAPTVFSGSRPTTGRTRPAPFAPFEAHPGAVCAALAGCPSDEVRNRASHVRDGCRL